MVKLEKILQEIQIKPSKPRKLPFRAVKELVVERIYPIFDEVIDQQEWNELKENILKSHNIKDLLNKLGNYGFDSTWELLLSIMEEN